MVSPSWLPISSDSEFAGASSLSVSQLELFLATELGSGSSSSDESGNGSLHFTTDRHLPRLSASIRRLNSALRPAASMCFVGAAKVY